MEFLTGTVPVNNSLYNVPDERIKSSNSELLLFQQFQNYLVAMAGLVEMNSFIGKFVNLWQSGCDASLKIESSAGKLLLFFNLNLDLPALKDIL